MKINIPLAWRSNLRTGPLFYSESDPTLYGLLTAYDLILQKVTGDKYCAKRPLLHQHHCSECGIEFWSSRETEGFCKRRACFMSFHQGGDNEIQSKSAETQI